MRSLSIIVLLWVVAVLIIAAWRLFVTSFSQYQVDRSVDQMNEQLQEVLSE